MAMRNPFTLANLTKVLKAYRDAGYPPPSLVIESGKITAHPIDVENIREPNEWDDVLK